MNYAIIEIGGGQHRVRPGDTIHVGRLAGGDARAGQTLQLDRVLVVRSEQTVKVGSPVVEGAAVKATVLGEIKGRKVLVFKKKRRKQYRRTRGHRQIYTALRIDEILAGD